MNIVFATSEMAPFVKTGGLADVLGALPRALAALGQKVKVFVPKYATLEVKGCPLEAVMPIDVTLGSKPVSGKIHRTSLEGGVDVFFVEQKGFFGRDHIYGTSLGDYPDNDARFIFFQKAVLAALKTIGFKPHIFHCHDWQTGLIPAYLKTLYNSDVFYKSTKSFFTIHNLAYQGIFPKLSFDLTGLPANTFVPDKLEFYGNLNCIKSGIVYADVVTTVSERYSQEIQLKEFGGGLEGVLRNRSHDLFGIVNGIDPAEWDPRTDTAITVTFSEEQLDRKYINKGVLQKENGLPVERDVPLIGIVSRLVDQKGFDLIIPLLEELATLPLQLVVLGTGDERYHRRLKEAADAWPHKFGVNILFDAKMARRVYAGSDMFLMPSHFEPCGLGQLIALRYCSVPIVRETGGLADTIMDFNRNTGQGNGFVFSEYSKEALLKTIKKALEYYKDRSMWTRIVTNGSRSVFSWETSAAQYVKLYESEKRKDFFNAF